MEFGSHCRQCVGRIPPCLAELFGGMGCCSYEERVDFWFVIFGEVLLSFVQSRNWFLVEVKKQDSDLRIPFEFALRHFGGCKVVGGDVWDVTV